MADPPASRPPRPPARAATDDRDVGVIERCLRADLSLAAGPGANLACSAERVHEPDLGTVDAVAHLALSARHSGLSLRVAGAPRALVDLLDLCGLADLLARLEASVESRIGPLADAGDSVEPGR